MTGIQFHWLLLAGGADSRFSCKPSRSGTVELPGSKSLGYFGLLNKGQFQSIHMRLPWDWYTYAYMETIKINHPWIGKYTVRPMDPSWDSTLECFPTSWLADFFLPWPRNQIYTPVYRKNMSSAVPCYRAKLKTKNHKRSLELRSKLCVTALQ